MTTEEFQELYKKHNKQLNAIAKRYRNGLDNFDIEHVKGLAIWKAYQNPENFKSFLINTMKWECCRLYTKKHSFKKGRTEHYDDSFENVDIQDLLSHLSEKERKIVSMKVFDNTSFSKIGEALNMSRESVRLIYLKAIKQLKSLI